MEDSLKLLLVSLMMMMMKTSAAAQNFCSNSTLLRTRTSCHSCSISLLMSCPSRFKQTPRSVAQDCRYYVRTSSLKLPISGCSFECYLQVELKRCCPGYWGPDCVVSDSTGTRSFALSLKVATLADLVSRCLRGPWTRLATPLRVSIMREVFASARSGLPRLCELPQDPAGPVGPNVVPLVHRMSQLARKIRTDLRQL
ncbi:unnamed protein product [Pleuronectes platessa]|uniref:Uncharacterized protein n=1 Tax=Pleuronectes platessa TaxID=8262 RepID=A0A9N7TIT2_PLEPL|nr:unnamed protein product [Pleuronectes platessa]